MIYEIVPLNASSNVFCGTHWRILQQCWGHRALELRFLSPDQEAICCRAFSDFSDFSNHA
jgi:hypothetical protein